MRMEDTQSTDLNVADNQQLGVGKQIKYIQATTLKCHNTKQFNVLTVLETLNEP